MEPKIKQQLSNNTYASREKECTPSGVLKGSWDGLILYVYFLQGRLNLQRDQKTKMIAAG
jgi:hypothetical protein